MYDSRQAAAFLSHSLALYILVESVFYWRKRFNSHLSPIEDTLGIDLSPNISQINFSLVAFDYFHSLLGDRGPTHLSQIPNHYHSGMAFG
jgi:hypothetical protein